MIGIEALDPPTSAAGGSLSRGERARVRGKEALEPPRGDARE
jgi:hypothetical protein